MSDNKYIPRTFQTPNAHVDELMHLLSGNEFKLLIFATRHILGWQDKISSRKANISLSMFEKGFTTKDGTHYNGCGLAKGTIISNLAPLAKFNILIPVGKATNAGQKYELTTNPDTNGLTERHNESKTSKQKQTAKARKINKNNTGGQLNSTSTVEQTTSSTVEQTGGGQLNSTESNPLSNTKKHSNSPLLCKYDEKPQASWRDEMWYAGRDYTRLVKRPTGTDPLTFPIRCNAIYHAWLGALAENDKLIAKTNIDLWRNSLNAIKALASAKVEPFKVWQYVNTMYQEDFWKGNSNPLPITNVQTNILNWQPEQPANKTFEFDIMDIKD